MKKQKSSYGLILASIVAVVAMMGLVMMFGSHTTGAATTYKALDCPGTWSTTLSTDAEGKTITTNIICNPGRSASGDTWGPSEAGVSWDNSAAATAWENEWATTGASPEWQGETTTTKDSMGKGTETVTKGFY